MSFQKRLMLVNYGNGKGERRFAPTGDRVFATPETLPLLDIKTLVNNTPRSVLIVAPHPDDETLGCGGAIALLRQLNVAVNVLVVSDGTKSHPNSIAYPPPALKKLREQESLAALAVLGIAPEAVTFLGLPDGAVLGRLHHDEIVKVDGETGGQGDESTKERMQKQKKAMSSTSFAIAFISQYLNNLTPSTIFLPYRCDPHPDHRASWQLFATATKNLTYTPHIVEYPIWDWDTKQRGNFTEQIKAWRLDINSVLELKQQAIAKYRSQISDLIDDDPEGFRLTPEMLQNFTQPWEVYLEVRATEL